MGNVIGTGILRFFGFCFGALPRRMQMAAGRALGSILYFFRLRFSVVDQNLKFAFPNDPEQREKTARAFYAHLGQLILEVFLLFGPLKKFVEKYVVMEGREHIENGLAKGKGILFLSSHVGNWEIMAASYGVTAKEGLLLVTKQLKPSWLHNAIEEGRRRCGVAGTYEPRTIRDVFSYLKKNKAVGIVLDQYAGAPIGVRVPLFGVPVGTSSALATLARRTGAAVLPVENFRNPDGTWIVRIHPALEWKTEDDAEHSREVVTNTAHYVEQVESHIKSHPDQWLWMHRRFKGELGALSAEELAGARART